MAAVRARASFPRPKRKYKNAKVKITKSADVDWRDRKTAAQCLSHLCLSEYLSDITFTFGNNVRLHAHKFVLSMRSCVFEAMFHGPLAEVGNTVLIKDINPDTIEVLLRFVYTDKPMLNGENVLSTLYAAKKYAVEGLVKLCSTYLETHINAKNVCEMHEQAVFYELKTLEKKCFDYILENASEVLGTKGFLNLPHATLHKLLIHDKLAEDEMSIYNATINWAKNYCKTKHKPIDVENLRESLGETLFAIRFPVMSVADFAKVVTPDGILTSDEQVMVYQYNALGKASKLNTFITNDRSGKSITIDVSVGKEYISAIGNTCGVHLRIEDTSEKTQSTKRLRLKSISGTFTERITSVFDENENIVIDYKIIENSICLTTPLEIVTRGRLDIRFSTVQLQNIQKQLQPSQFQSFVVDMQKEVYERSIYLSEIPSGIETITFIR